MRFSVGSSVVILVAVGLWSLAVFSILLGLYNRNVMNHGATSVYYELKKGTGLNIMAKQLSKRRVISVPSYFVWLAYFKGVSRKLQAGEYAILPKTTVAEFIDMVHQGKVISYSITFSEGMTFSQIKQRLAMAGPLIHESQSLSDGTILEKIGSHYQKPEGLFFPETYRFVKGTTDLQILKQANRSMEDYIDKIWQESEQDLPFQTPYEALVAASLIEKETALDEERPLIAAVIVNRIRKDMPLQFDPTVIYGLGSAYSGKLTRKDLRFDTPYNTYIHKGLPPTPIALAGIASLKAALNPSDDDYLYFVATGQGGHQFSTTLQRHQEAVKVYLKHLQEEATHNEQ